MRFFQMGWFNHQLLFAFSRSSTCPKPEIQFEKFAAHKKTLEFSMCQPGWWYTLDNQHFEFWILRFGRFGSYDLSLQMGDFHVPMWIFRGVCDSTKHILKVFWPSKFVWILNRSGIITVIAQFGGSEHYLNVWQFWGLSSESISWPLVDEMDISTVWPPPCNCDHQDEKTVHV